jgi:hypothetical protein
VNRGRVAAQDGLGLKPSCGHLQPFSRLICDSVSIPVAAAVRRILSTAASLAEI